MPARVHLISIRPELDEENQLPSRSWLVEILAIKRLNWRIAWKNPTALPRLTSSPNTSPLQAPATALSFDINGVYVS